MSALHETCTQKCADILTDEEAEVSVRLLNSALKNLGKKAISLSCPEINIAKKVAIIRSPVLTLDLVNPKILFASDRVISYQESCASHLETKFNCWRYGNIVLEIGVNKRFTFTYSGIQAFLIQHEVDHLHGKLLQDRKICLALARNDGRIKEKDYCPCASRKRFRDCCSLKDGDV